MSNPEEIVQQGSKFVGVTFKSELQDGSQLGQVTYKEFEFLCAQINGLLGAMNFNGSVFTNIVTGGLTVTNNFDSPIPPNIEGGTITVISNGSIVNLAKPAPLDTYVQVNVDDAFGAFSGFRWLYSTIPIQSPIVGAVANTGAGAYAATIRYYKIQWLTIDGVGHVTSASELGPVFSFTPSGAGTAARITRPSAPAEATHWVVFASATNVDANFVQVSSSIAIATTTYDDSTVPASYSGTSPLASYSDRAQLRLTTNESRSDSTLLIQTEDQSTNLSVNFFPATDYQELAMGAELALGVETMRVTAPAYIWRIDDGGASHNNEPTLSLSITPDQTVGGPYVSGPWGELAIHPSYSYFSGGEDALMGTGAIGGYSLLIGHNASGGGAAGTLSMVAKDGTRYYIWVDATGDVRIGPAAPTESGSVSDTSGTVIGTQT